MSNEGGFETKEEAGNPPEFCENCKPWIDRSRLHWSLCGGLNVGMTRQPFVWRLFPDDSVEREREKTRNLQCLAASARLANDLKAHVADPEMLARIDRYLEMLRRR